MEQYNFLSLNEAMKIIQEKRSLICVERNNKSERNVKKSTSFFEELISTSKKY